MTSPRTIDGAPPGRPDDPLLNTEEAAAYLNVPISTLRNHRRAWGLHPFKVGRALQFPRSELDQYLERHRETAEDADPIAV